MPTAINPYILLAFGGFMWCVLVIVGYKLSMSGKESNKVVWDIVKLLTGGLFGYFFGMGGVS